MPFLILGLIIIMTGGVLFRLSRKLEDKYIAFGSIALIIAGLILIIVYGLFYRSVALNY